MAGTVKFIISNKRVNYLNGFLTSGRVEEPQVLSRLVLIVSGFIQLT